MPYVYITSAITMPIVMVHNYYTPYIKREDMWDLWAIQEMIADSHGMFFHWTFFGNSSS